ncbi:MAG: hypothetical protein ACQEVA_04545 [Myxococcota bacterium]
MEFEEALAPDVDVETFFLEKVAEVHRSRLEVFSRGVDTPIIVCVALEDIDERYTFEFRPDGIDVEHGEMIDFPVVTIIGKSIYWDTVRDHLREIAEIVQDRASDKHPPRKLTRDFLDKFERFDGIIELQLADEDLDERVLLKIVLNDYDAPSGARHVTIRAPFSLGLELARGDVHPSNLEQHVSASGDMGLAFDLTGFLNKEFPELGL